MMKDSPNFKRAMNLTWVARSLERNGDHAKNVSEYFIYMVEARDVRNTSVVEAAPDNTAWRSEMKMPGTRQLNPAAFIACAGMNAYAQYANHVLLLMPSPLCVFQRIAVNRLALVFLLADAHEPAG